MIRSELEKMYNFIREKNKDMIRSELEKMYNFIRKTLVAVCLIGGIFTAGLAEAVKIETAQIRITGSDNYGSEEDVSLHAVGRIIAKDIITSSSNGLSNSKITINGSTQLVRNSPNFQFLVLSDLTITEGLLNAFNSNIGVLTLSTNYLKNIQNCSILDLNADETDTGMFLAPDGNGKVIWSAADYLPLAGHNGPVVLGTSIRGFGATTNVGTYGFAAGRWTSAGYAGFAAGEGTSAGDHGFAAGSGTSAGKAGFAAGANTSAGDYGFAAGRAAQGADGSFVFADNSTLGTLFDRTNRPNEFAARAAGGVYFDTPMMVVTGTVSAGSITLGTNAPITNWPEGGTGTGATQLIANIQGQAARTSTYDAGTATLTLADLPAPEGGGGGTASVGVEGDVLTYAFATNIALLASTNFWPQRILEITNDFTLQVPAMADTNAAGIIWLTVPSISTHTATIPTSSPPILGYVPALATNAESELLFRWSPQATGWRVRRIR